MKALLSKMMKIKYLILLLCCFAIDACKDNGSGIDDFHQIQNWFSHDLEFNREVKEELNSRIVFNKLLYKGLAPSD